MPLDTSTKRRAAAGIGMSFGAPGVSPNSSKDVIWRHSAAWSYSFYELTEDGAYKYWNGTSWVIVNLAASHEAEVDPHPQYFKYDAAFMFYMR